MARVISRANSPFTPRSLAVEIVVFTTCCGAEFICNTKNDARLAGSGFVVRIQRCPCYSKFRKDAPRPSKMGTLSNPGEAIFTLLLRTRPPRPSCATALFFHLPSTEKPAATSANNPAGRPKRPRGQKVNFYLFSPKNRKGPPPQTEKWKKARRKFPFFRKKRIRYGAKRA